ncbi:unnamed protein product [Ixodes persulcatus]
MRMFAYVRFTDGVPHFLPTTMIRKYSPSNDKDFDAARIYEAYWVSDCNEQEDYYDAKILLLGASLDELLRKMQTKRYAIPRIVGGSSQLAPPAGKHVQDLSHKERKKKKKETGNRARLESIAANFKKTQKKTKETEACSQSQDDMVPMHVFKEQEAMIKKLKRQLVEERNHSRRLAQALATKIEVASGQSWDRPGTSGEGFQSSELPSPQDAEWLEDEPCPAEDALQNTAAVPSTSGTRCPPTKQRQHLPAQVLPGKVPAQQAPVTRVHQQRASHEQEDLPIPAALPLAVDTLPLAQQPAVNQVQQDLPVPVAAPRAVDAPQAGQQPGRQQPVPAMAYADSAPLVLAVEGGIVHLGSNTKVGKKKKDRQHGADTAQDKIYKGSMSVCVHP